jgi:hypothetical protein
MDKFSFGVDLLPCHTSITSIRLVHLDVNLRQKFKVLDTWSSKVVKLYIGVSKVVNVEI